MSWEENTAVQDEQANWAEFRAGRCVLEVICDNPGRVRTNTVIWEDSAVSAETSASVLQFWDVLQCGVSLVEPAATTSRQSAQRSPHRFPYFAQSVGAN